VDGSVRHLMTASPSTSLAGRRALVTGAAGGIGAAAVRQLELAGATVTGVDAAAGYDGVVADVTDPAAMASAVAAAGELDICVANAGVSLMEPFVEGDPASWRRVIEIDLIGVMVTLQAATRAMAGRPGSLIAVSSIAAMRGEPDTSAYAAAKAGVIGLVRQLSVELAPAITVNAVAPGQIDTGMQRRDLDVLGRRIGRPAADLLREHLELRVPARRLGLAEEVGALIAFLASEAAAFITGEAVRIDGGECAS
jgi:NAD(P)-dependent dehydrogenase (short-subunit alcohol dehydrogenase family)